MATHKPVRIQDVARRAGVSISTISNALNGRTARMSAQTLARIEATIAELGFRPNRAARQLKTGHNPILGLLVPSIANPAFGMLAREVEIAAQAQFGYRVMLGNTHRSQDKETSFFDDLLAHGVRGVIVCSSLVDQRHLDAAVARGLVVVSYDRRATPGRAPTVDHVSVDSFRAGRLAAQHLIDHGHRRLAFATPSGRTVSRSDKIAGFMAAVRAAGLSRSARTLEGQSRVAFGDSEAADLGRALAVDIAGDRKRPTGIVAVNDMLAIGLMAGLRDCGLAVPEDVSIVGIDDLFLSSLFRPALTSIRSPLADIARKMVERIIARLADAKVPPAEFLFEPELVVRESVARPESAAAVQHSIVRPERHHER
jgi:DNA-binding LacI/PurR family transcriptional regulator